MSESQALLRLQEIDLELIRLHRLLQQMPQQKKLAAIASAKRKLTSQILVIVGQRKDKQMELEDNEHRHNDVLCKTREVKAEAAERAQNFRRTRDLEAHLSALGKQLDKLEHACLSLAAELERIEKAEHNARALEEKLEAEQKVQQESFDRESSELRARVRKLHDARASVIQEISKLSLTRYDAAVKRFGGLAVESLKGNVPTICRVKLQPSDYGDLKRGPKISECPYCHRILIIEASS